MINKEWARVTVRVAVHVLYVGCGHALTEQLLDGGVVTAMQEVH
jgi:hypothetical protein